MAHSAAASRRASGERSAAVKAASGDEAAAGGGATAMEAILRVAASTTAGIEAAAAAAVGVCGHILAWRRLGWGRERRGGVGVGWKDVCRGFWSGFLERVSFREVVSRRFRLGRWRGGGKTIIPLRSPPAPTPLLSAPLPGGAEKERHHRREAGREGAKSGARARSRGARGEQRHRRRALADAVLAQRERLSRVLARFSRGALLSGFRSPGSPKNARARPQAALGGMSADGEGGERGRARRGKRSSLQLLSTNVEKASPSGIERDNQKKESARRSL